MDTPAFYMTIAVTAFAAVTMLALVGLKGFSGWLELKRAELTANRPVDVPPSTAGARIEIADLKERIKKLEAIAAGVDL